MKKLGLVLLFMTLMAILLILPAYAAEETVGDVTFTYEANMADAETVTITGYAIASTVTEPMDLVIPATLSSGTLTVTDVQPIPQALAAKIRSVTFAASTLPVIHGNLYEWRAVETVFGFDIAVQGLGSPSLPMPNTPVYLTMIPAFITDNYNYDSNGDGTDDTYYAGENLVRVDTAYSGALTVKAGTVSILAGALQGCADVTAVTLPDSVEWIGMYAFADSGVTAVNIPLGLMTNGSDKILIDTFANCTRLQTVTFPNGTDKLGEVGYAAFFNCSALTGFDFSRVEKVAGYAFAKAFTAGTAVDLASAKLDGRGSVGTPTPGVFACSGCTYLTDITWGNVVYVCAGAFANCTALTADVLATAERVVEIQFMSFTNTGMTVLTIPESVQMIAGGAFHNNKQLVTLNWYGGTSSTPFFAWLNDCTGQSTTDPIYYAKSWQDLPDAKPNAYTFPTTLNIYKIPAGPPNMFSMQPYLETVHYYCDVTEVPQNAFLFCSSLETVTFSAPEKLLTIGVAAFQGCFALNSFPFTSLTGLTTIGAGAFLLWGTGSIGLSDYEALSAVRKAYGLTEIDLSACTALTTIQTGAFHAQYNVTEAILPAACVGSSCFTGLTNLKELALIGDETVSLGSYAFSAAFYAGWGAVGHHPVLETLTIECELQDHDDPMLYRMENLKTVNLPNATVIPAYTFLGCTALTTVYAPKVTHIGAMAFSGTAIAEAVIDKDVTYGNGVFAGCANLKNVVVEEGVTALNAFTFENCTALEKVSLPSTLVTVGWGAFKNAKACFVSVPASVQTVEDDAFSGAAHTLILNGATAIKTYYEAYDGGSEENTLLPIDASATVYYASAAAKTAADAYLATFAAGADVPALKAINAGALAVSGAPATLTAGADLTGVKVTLNGVELNADQYTLDYDKTNTATGDRTVTVTVTDTALLADRTASATLTVKGLDGADVSGAVPTFVTSAVTGSFTLSVVAAEVTAPENNAAAEDEGNEKGKLPAGAVVAIVIGAVAVAAGGGFALYWFVIRPKTANAPKTPEKTEKKKDGEA